MCAEVLEAVWEYFCAHTAAMLNRVPVATNRRMVCFQRVTALFVTGVGGLMDKIIGVPLCMTETHTQSNWGEQAEADK